MIKAKIKITKKIFYSEKTGFGVFRAQSCEGSKEGIIIVGNLIDIKKNDFLQIEGKTVQHPRFGQQIQVEKFSFIKPLDRMGIIKYLQSGRFKGVGKKTAQKIVDQFGEDTLEILENNPQRLHEISGIGRKVIEEIARNIQLNQTIKDLTIKLAPFGIGNETIFKIFQQYQLESLEIIKQDPYLLIENIKGIGFKIADTIARAFQISPNDPRRIQSGIKFVIYSKTNREGDLFFNRMELITESAAILGVSQDELSVGLDQMVERGDLAQENTPDPVIQETQSFQMEQKTAQMLATLNQANLFSSASKAAIDTSSLSTSAQNTLTEEQQKAVISAFNNKITIITGGPGTGKTTIIKALIELFHAHNKEIKVAAPTGRAAKRIEEATYYQASTIHRLLKINPETRAFVHNQANPIPADVVIIDEFSMVDSFLFYALLKAVSNLTKLVLIGDKDQLPSVGPGNVLRDLIHSNCFQIYYLNRNFRQQKESLIIENAYKIKNNQPLIMKPYSDILDFVYISIQSEEQAVKKTLGILDYYQDQYRFNSPHLQILSPMYRGTAGIDNLNHTIQEKLNNHSFCLNNEKKSLKLNDKVMQVRNNYDKQIFNGEQGLIRDFDKKVNVLYVDFEGFIVEYNPDELDEITLSYAVSVHKSQGSEFDVVILILLPGHSIMLNREIFYTAVTRAKKKIFLLSDPETISRATANSSPIRRKTMLKLRLEQCMEPVQQNVK